MKKTFLLSAAALALIASPLAFQNAADAQISTRSDAMTIDPQRGVLTMAPLLERVTPAVVSINTLDEGDAPDEDRELSREEQLMERFFGGRLPNTNRGPRAGLGSGVIVDADEGLIITNNHVIEDADEITVTLEDRRRIEATLVGTDPDTDIALLKIDADNLRELRLARAGEAKVGDYVIAVGNPFGLSSTVTSGIISALGREQGGGLNRSRYENYIQTDASINPGNSGGALINSKGELIGINTAIVSRSGSSAGIGFAVPIRTVENVVEQLRENGEVRRGRIGVIIQDVTPELRAGLGLRSLNGALVSEVGDDTPAEKAGLESGDVVIDFNGEDVIDSSDLRNFVGLLQPGTRADITYLREGSRRTTKITVEAAPEDEAPTRRASSEPEEMEMMEAFDGAEVSNIPDELELRGGEDGVYVANVDRGSRAQRAGLVKGDVIRKVGKNDISDLDDFEDAVRGDGPFALQIERQGRNLFLAVK